MSKSEPFGHSGPVSYLARGENHRANPSPVLRVRYTRLPSRLYGIFLPTLQLTTWVSAMATMPLPSRAYSDYTTQLQATTAYKWSIYVGQH